MFDTIFPAAAKDEYSTAVGREIVQPMVRHLVEVASGHPESVIRTAAIAELLRLVTGRSAWLRVAIITELMPRVAGLFGQERDPSACKLLADLSERLQH